MQTQLLERRRECLEMRSKGLPLPYVVNQMAQKYEVTERAVYKDWAKRKAWIKGILDMKDPETLFLDILANHKALYNEAVIERVKADNSNARIGALNLLRKINKDFLEILVISNLVADVDDLKRTVGKITGKEERF